MLFHKNQELNKGVHSNLFYSSLYTILEIPAMIMKQEKEGKGV